MTCPQCKSEIRDGSTYCPHCGCHSFNKNYSDGTIDIGDILTPGKTIFHKKWVVLLLSILFGYISIHYFYMKHIKKGIIWFLINAFLFAAIFLLSYLCKFSNKTLILLEVSIIFAINIGNGLRIYFTNYRDGNGDLLHR